MAAKTSASTPTSTSPKKNNGDEWLILGGVVALVVFWPKISAWGEAKLESMAGSRAAELAATLLPLVWVVLAAIAVLFIYRLFVGGLRRKKRDMIIALLDDLLPKSWDPEHGIQISFKMFRATPSKVVVTYPSEFPDRDPKWKAALVDAISYRADMDAYTTRWDPSRLRVTVTRATPEPETELSEADRNRASVLTRTHLVIASLFPSDIRLSIPQWTAEANDPPGGYPLQIDVAYEPTTRDASAQWRRRLEAVVSLKVPPGNARWVAQYKTASDEITLKHRPPLPNILVHPGPSLWANQDGITLPYAQDENGNLATWAISGKASKMRPTVHTLIIGPTGTGKTSVMRSLLTAATGQGVWVIACDPKRIELTPFRGWPGVLAVGSNEEDMGQVIKAAYELMMSRYTLIEAGQADADDMTPVLLFLDELLILQARLNRWWNQNKAAEGVAELWGTKSGTTHPAMGLIAELLALARSANIRVIEGVQRPDAELFEKGARDNLRHRIGLGRLSQQGAEMLWGDSYTGTDTPMISGRAVASPDGTTPLEVQMYWTPDPRTRKEPDAALMAQLRIVAEAAFEDVEPPEGLNLSAVSASAKSVPEGDMALAETVSMTAVTDYTTQLSTQTVGAATLVVGDRVVDADGQVWDVTEVEEAENPDDPDLWDFMHITLSGPDGERYEEAPGEATFERVMDAAL